MHLRGGGLDILPAFGQILFKITEWAHTQLSPDIHCIFLFGKENLPQSLYFILHLKYRSKNIEKGGGLDTSLKKFHKTILEDDNGGVEMRVWLQGLCRFSFKQHINLMG